MTSDMFCVGEGGGGVETFVYSTVTNASVLIFYIFTALCSSGLADLEGKKRGGGYHPNLINDGYHFETKETCDFDHNFFCSR